DLAGVARLGGLVVAALAAGRLLTVTGRWVALGAGSALALGLGALGSGPALVLAAAGAGALGVFDLGRPAGAPAGSRRTRPPGAPPPLHGCGRGGGGSPLPRRCSPLQTCLMTCRSETSYACRGRRE